MSDPNELEHLESLVTSGGWGWLRSWCEREWGDAAMFKKIETIARKELDAATKQAQQDQAIVARDAVRGLLMAPEHRIGKLKYLTDVKAFSASRRGPGL